MNEIWSMKKYGEIEYEEIWRNMKEIWRSMQELGRKYEEICRTYEGNMMKYEELWTLHLYMGSGTWKKSELSHLWIWNMFLWPGLRRESAWELKPRYFRADVQRELEHPSNIWILRIGNFWAFPYVTYCSVFSKSL